MDIIALNLSSKDKRVTELGKICKAKKIKTVDSNSKDFDHTKAILFVEPRATLPPNHAEYKHVFDYKKLSEDDKFIEDNNYLTALAMKEIIDKKFGDTKQKMLIVGYGKLTAQLERVLCDADIHILNFNHHKVQEVMVKYGDKSFFEEVDFHAFPIVINTIPKKVLDASKFSKDTVIYELASAPYGMIGDTTGLQYEILPALPGKFYPKPAAQVVFDAIERALAKDERPTVVLCITGSSCCYLKLLPVVVELVKSYNLIPVLSPSANIVNRFYDIEKFRKELFEICGNPIVTTITASELLSANKKIVASLVLPATGNTVAKLANAITDTPVCMAVKALLRNSKPCIVGISSNDALSGNAVNIGTLLNRKNYYFIPYSQDDPINKPFSMVCDFAKAGATIEMALKGKQIQPIIC